MIFKAIALITLISLPFLYSTLDYSLIYYLFHGGTSVVAVTGLLDENPMNLSPQAYFVYLVISANAVNETDLHVGREAMEEIDNVLPMDTRVFKEIFELRNFSVEMHFRRGLEIRNDSLTPTLIYFHGGGYVAGSADAYSGFASLWALEDFRVIVPNYRKSPEFSMEEIMIDALDVYDWALDDLGVNPDNLGIIGDSAGGGLALNLIQRLIARNRVLPKVAAVSSPWLDILLSSPEFKSKRSDPILDPDEIECGIPFLKLEDNHKKHYSPLYGSLDSMIPLIITSGTLDPLHDDSVRFVKRLQEEHKEHEFIQVENMFHDFLLFKNYFPEAEQAFNKVSQFIYSKMK